MKHGATVARQSISIEIAHCHTSHVRPPEKHALFLASTRFGRILPSLSGPLDNRELHGRILSRQDT